VSWKKLVYFFDKNLTTSIDNKDFLSEVEIDYEYQESFGNTCVKVSYIVKFNDKGRDLSLSDKIKLAEDFAETSFCIYTLHPSRSYTSDDSLKLSAFKNIYLSVTGFTILRLEREFGTNFPIRVKSIDNWPEANYAEKYINDLIQNTGFYKVRDSNFDQDVSQHEKLMKLSVNHILNSRKKKKFELSDEYLVEISQLKYYQIRWIMINNEVPLLIDGYATISKVWVRPLDFLEATKKEIKEKELIGRNSAFAHIFSELKYLIERVYQDFLPREKQNLITKQKEQFIKLLNLESGDVLELYDGRIVSLSQIYFNQDSELSISYSLLKTNLDLSQRTGEIMLNEIDYFLKYEAIVQYKSQNVVIRKSPFRNWMKKRKLKFNYTPFVPNLVQTNP
tara:strand:+ start:102032 stop:103207 length:1176 start_codon:yes stop_codon:yes gene_type:complete